MKTAKHLPDAELAVMQAVWSLEPPVTASAVQQQVPQDWKATSVLTFLSRLCDKGFLSCRKEGRQNLYTPLVSRAAYLQQESRSFVERLCGGSVKNLVASLSDAGALTESDVEELRAFLDVQGR
ncbi:BlaI/MecI/CopY family transcriptional regulator [Agathobaculum desmolans]|uniref:BlaI/MecI/CopY family transcriptional regulator n=1 Tax=Agathobaculum desmolans TaxID=39484 RepID=UPI0004E167D3|nr:BlaI/MecI/CopY family transcriptional regulator [Agathobaculum desmolans]